MRHIKLAEAARDLYATPVCPSVKDYKWLISSNQIKNWPVTVQYIDVAKKVWGKDIVELKGKTPRDNQM